MLLEDVTEADNRGGSKRSITFVLANRLIVAEVKGTVGKG
jgi:hypothetical protein